MPKVFIQIICLDLKKTILQALFLQISLIQSWDLENEYITGSIPNYTFNKNFENAYS